MANILGYSALRHEIKQIFADTFYNQILLPQF